MTRIRLTAKCFAVLFLALVLLLTALLPVDREGRFFTLIFHTIPVTEVMGDPNSYYSVVSLPQTAVFKVPMTPETTHFECQPTWVHEKRVYDHFREQEEQLKRRAHLQQACLSEAGNSTFTELNRKHFLVDRNRKILYCWIHKVASTSWISFLARLRGLQVRTKRIYREISRLSATSNEEVWSAARDYHIKFIVVRHPFHRLISAYRDRIWAAKHKYSAQAVTHVPRIFRLTRPNLFWFHSLSSIMHNNSRTLTAVPTFEEFVQYLLAATNEVHHNISRKTAFDVHWAPYHQHCSVCKIPFNVIIKLETIEDDKNYLIEELQFQQIHRRDTEKMKEESKELSIGHKSHEPAESPKINMNTKASFTSLHSNERSYVTVFQENKPISLTTKKTLMSTTQLENKSSEAKELQLISTNLDNFQVSNIGPSCPCYYFSQLSSEQINGLAKIYERDFKIFGYTTEEYIRCVTPKI